jgi:hypothetical protein
MFCFSQPLGCGAVLPPGCRSGEDGVFLFFCCFVVVGANRKSPKLLPVGMADVGWYSVKMCFCQICKPWLGICRQELFFRGRRPLLASVVTRRICVALSCAARGQHAPGSVPPGLAREGHCLLFRLRFVPI